jgi:t-SNARE complex subunit (syntaxin)
VRVADLGAAAARSARQVTRAYAATKKGVVELQKANDNARKNRKRMCCIWWCLVIALVAILFPMLASALFGI